MATSWVLLFTTIMCVVYPTDVSSRVIRSYVDCFEDLLKCTVIIAEGDTWGGLENLNPAPWYHCRCTNEFAMCIEQAIGPYTPDRQHDAYDRYLELTGAVCIRPIWPEYEKIPAPLTNPVVVEETLEVELC